MCIATLGSYLLLVAKPSVLHNTATGGLATIHESLHEFSFDIFLQEPQYSFLALYLKCHSEQQIAQRLSQAVPVTDNLLFGC